ncbi:MAG: alkaline phosphatase [Gammaproteobacteria bacterium]|nr:alkaline phosphatase [Gammaproteobacteria bacterium]
MRSHWPLALIIAAAAGHAAPRGETPEGWYRQGENAARQAMLEQPVASRARNVILFLGDGMGVTTVTSARILAGQRQGGNGEEHLLEFERFPYSALIKTYTTNQQVPDSAGTMSAIMTGIKTLDGVLSVDQDIVRGDCASARGHERPTLLEQFERAGRATGIISSARITHATPAATYAHLPDRDWETDSDLPAAAAAAGCRDIARQLVEFGHGDGIEVIFGGGRSAFLPAESSDPEYPAKKGARRDGRDLIQVWRRRYPDGTFLWNGAKFAALDLDRHGRVMGLFEPSHMQFEADRERDTGSEPSLAQMTATAIRILSRDRDGFFLMVEGGRIDHALHGNNAHHALTDTAAFSDAVAAAVGLTRMEDTLIIVTADHSHVLTMAGYPTRGNPILGLVVENDAAGRPMTTASMADDGKPYTTLGFANGPAARVPRRDLRGIDTGDPGFTQDAMVALESETHGGEDVAAYARGPWAHLVRGVREQHYLYHVMRLAAQLDER